MYPIENGHFGFKQRANKIDGLRNASFLVPHIDNYIWQGLLIWLEVVCKELETNQKRRDDIRQLEVKNKELTLTKHSEYYTAELPEDYYRHLESYSYCKTDKCKTKKIKNFLIQKDDVYEDFMYESSYVFERVNIDLSTNKLYIYNKDFDIEKVILTYIRKPKRPANPNQHTAGDGTIIGEYNYPDGTQAIQQDIEIDSTFQIEKILDIAALIALRDTGNTIDYNSQLNKILNISKI